MQIGGVRGRKDGRGPGPQDERRPRVRASLQRLHWMCAAVGMVAVGVLLWLFGLTWRTGIGIAIFVACPIIVVWVLSRAGREGSLQPETDG